MPKTYKCPCCGKRFTRRLAPDAYVENNCYDCSFWLVKVNYPHYMVRHQVIISGHHYMWYAETAGFIRGFGGRRFKIQFLDGRIVETNNLWHNGQVPERFRSMLPDNAEFLPLDSKCSSGGPHV